MLTRSLTAYGYSHTVWWPAQSSHSNDRHSQKWAARCPNPALPTPTQCAVPLPQQLVTSQDQDGKSKGKAVKTLTVYREPGKYSKPVHKATSPQEFERQKVKMHAFIKSQVSSATQRKINLFAFCSSLSIFNPFLKSYFMSE